MSFLNRLLGKSEPPKQRVQVCVECGMPVADHKQWCSILQGQNEMKLKAARRSRRKPASRRRWWWEYFEGPAPVVNWYRAAHTREFWVFLSARR